MRHVVPLATALLLGVSSLAMAQSKPMSALQDPNMTATDKDTQQTVMEKLKKDGYTEISDLKKDADGGWHGKATKGGKHAEVYLDNLSKIHGLSTASSAKK